MIESANRCLHSRCPQANINLYDGVREAVPRRINRPILFDAFSFCVRPMKIDIFVFVKRNVNMHVSLNATPQWGTAD